MALKKRAGILTALAIFSVAATFYRLENWMPHQEDPLMLLVTMLLMPVSAILGVLQLVQGIRTKSWWWLLLGTAAAALCFWGARTYWNIPFCLECNGGVPEGALGWMTPWFYGE